MILAKEENATKTYTKLQRQYFSLKALLNSMGVNLIEIDYIKENSNMTPREEQLFNLRNKEYSLEECAEYMNCSISTVYRVNKSMKKKIMRVI